MVIHDLLLGVKITSLAFALLLFIPCATLFCELMAAYLTSPEADSALATPPPRLTVLVPAHNEALVIQATLEGILPQLKPGDSLLVIADHCSDATAEVARACGVEVIERVDPDPLRRGKGYALDFGFKYLAAHHPPEVVVTIDADCLVAPGTIGKIARRAYQLGRPVQATYLMTPALNSQVVDSFSALAVFLKNQVRPLGLLAMGWPNLLTGSGIALPWSVVPQVSMATSKTCDDMQASIDLAIAGFPVVYCPHTLVTGRLMAQAAALSQRSRWEHGHLEIITVEVPRLLKAAIQQRRLDLVYLALDLAVPPLSLLVGLWLAATLTALCTGFLSSYWLPTELLALEGLGLLVAFLAVWIKFRPPGLTLSHLWRIPLYLAWKVPVYVNYLSRPQTRWLRTERDD